MRLLRLPGRTRKGEALAEVVSMTYLRNVIPGSGAAAVADEVPPVALQAKLSLRCGSAGAFTKDVGGASAISGSCSEAQAIWMLCLYN